MRLRCHCAISIVFDRRCASPRRSIPFGNRMLHTFISFRFAGYLESLPIPDTAAPFQGFMDTALSCMPRTNILTIRTPRSRAPFSLPGETYHFWNPSPGRLCSRGCIIAFWLDNAQRITLLGLTIAGDGCQTAFTCLATCYPTQAWLFCYQLVGLTGFIRLTGYALAARVGLEPTSQP